MSRNPGYMPQIDALRFFAAFGVMSFHWANRFKLDLNLSFGPYRVPLLLVLSGFLITSILLKTKDRSTDKVQAMKTLYFKRALRIIPAYYLLLFAAIKLNDVYVIRYFPYFVTFTSNILSFSGKEVYTSSTSHLWNISVLEQFYLLFPWVFIFIRQQYEVLLGVSMIITGTVFKAYGFAAAIPDINMLPPTSFDYLGGGTLLAVLCYRNSNELDTLIKGKANFLILAFFALSYYFFFHSKGWVAPLGYNLATLLFCCALIYKASVGFTGIIGKMLSFKPLVFLGRISYGMYIYHMISPFVLRRIFEKTGMAVGYGYKLYLFNILFLLIVCIASWYMIEKPITNLRKVYWKDWLAIVQVRRIGRLFRA